MNLSGELNSVWTGDDAAFLEHALQFYPALPPTHILDATVNVGKFWRGSCRTVVGMDVNASFRPSVVGDNRRMPFRCGQFQVVVYDPPHVPNQGRDRQKDFRTRFGLGERSGAQHNYNFTHTYPVFLAEAYRVLAQDGILLAKLIDYIHNHRYQWAHVEFYRAAVEAGFTACDLRIKVRPGPIRDPRWKIIHHARRNHAYWMVFRKSRSCER